VRPTTSEFDYVIVGAGTAGCLLANRLSAGGSASVLLLEAGRKDNYHWIHVPVGYLYCIGNPRTDWLFATEPDPGLNGRALRYPRGKVLGGCSSINGMIYMRGQSRDYDQWARLTGEDEWSWFRCLADFKAHEDHWRGLDQWHAAPGFDHSGSRSGGEWRVERQRLKWEILDAFSMAAQQAGVPPTNDFNRGSNEGVGYFEVNQRSGWRWNASKAFLRPALARADANLSVWTDARVTRLNLKRTDGALRCVGADVQTDAGIVTVRARREVVLCAGAIGTPQLLQVSGLGPGDLLRSCGIPVQQDMPGVGQNLQDHLQVRTVFKVHGTNTLNTKARSWGGKVAIALEYALRRTGPMSMAPSQLGIFTRSSFQQIEPNVQFHVQPLSLEALGEPLHGFDAITASVCNLNPTSRGSVRIRSSDAGQPPAIVPQYLSTFEDCSVAVDSIRLARRIVAQPAMARFQPEELKPGIQFQTSSDLTRLAGDISTTIFHPVGTAKMGPKEDAMAVVTPRLKVRGISGLRVADASIMPTITSGNTNSPTLMIAEKAARWIQEAD
jgi:choline dehydrogenase